MTEKHAGGRPSKYDEKFNEQVYKLCLLGATDKEMADFFQIDEATFHRWKHDYPQFCDSLTRGKMSADADVAKSLYQRARGYEHKETITATFQGKITDTMDVIKHYPPDTPAATLWLKNRQPNKWRDKVETEITGPNGGPIELANVTNLEIDDLLRLEEILAKGQLQLTD